MKCKNSVLYLTSCLEMRNVKLCEHLLSVTYNIKDQLCRRAKIQIGVLAMEKSKAEVPVIIFRNLCYS